MASITSLMNTTSSTSSLYGTKNVISGLASGMDTEAMIENAVSGYNTKIANLQQDRTMLEWEQDAYRSIIDKLSNFADKYTSYTSSTNLLSSSFFTNAASVSASGTYTDKITATGKSDSDIKILSVQTATAATYSGKKIGDTVTASTKLSELTELGLNSGDLKSFKINDTEIHISGDDTLASVAAKITSSGAGVTASFSETTGAFYLKSKATGADSQISIEESDLANGLFGKVGEDGDVIATEGRDAQVKMNVNGVDVEKTYTGNQINVDGMTINLKGDFTVAAGEEAVSFSTSVDADKIVNAIKSMVADFNTMANEIKDAYSTRPLYDSSGKRYEPLTEKDKNDLSETAVENYEKKAKTGILFADSDLSSLYDQLRSAANSLGFGDIGITTEYSAGKTTLALDEEKLRSVLESDPDKVKDAFTQTGGGMEKLRDTIDTYAKTTGTKGILVNLAGSTKSALSLTENTYKSRMDEVDEEIKRWQQKLVDKVDYYTMQFTRLEKLISDMNAQSSSLSGLMGY